MHDAFKNFEERPTKQEIKLTFQQDQHLTEIMQRRGGFGTCYNKVKNIFQKSSNWQLIVNKTTKTKNEDAFSVIAHPEKKKGLGGPG